MLSGRFEHFANSSIGGAPCCVFLSGLASHMMTSSLRRLLVAARALAEGKK